MPSACQSRPPDSWSYQTLTARVATGRNEGPGETCPEDRSDRHPTPYSLPPTPHLWCLYSACFFSCLGCSCWPHLNGEQAKTSLPALVCSLCSALAPAGPPVALCSSPGREQGSSLKPRRPRPREAEPERNWDWGREPFRGGGWVWNGGREWPTGASHQHRVRGCPTWAWSASRMPLCQSRASCTGVREACEQGHWVGLPPACEGYLSADLAGRARAGTHHVLHAQLGPVEQQQLRCSVVPVAHGFVECGVPFLRESRPSLLGPSAGACC